MDTFINVQIDIIPVKRREIADESVNLIAAMIAVILILIGALFLFSFNESFYRNQFESNDVYEDLNLSEERANEEFFRVTDYVSDRTSEIGSDFFNDKEKQHLDDVKDIFQSLKVLFFVLQTFLVILIVRTIYISDDEPFRLDFRKVVKYMNMVFAALVGLAVLISFNFTRAFTLMHEILFSNDLYLLDPVTDNLIIYLPETVFVQISIRVLAFSLVILALFNIYNITKHKKRMAHTPANGKKKG